MRTSTSTKRKAGTDEPLIRATRAQIASMGLNAVSARAVATSCGMNPASIHQRFGDRAGLLSATIDSAIAADETILTSLNDEISATTIPASRRADALHYLFVQLFSAHREAALIRWNVIAETKRTDAYRREARRWIKMHADFWVKIGDAFEFTAEGTVFVSHAVEQFGRGYLISNKPLLFDGWAKDFSRRIVERLTGQKISFTQDSPWRKTFIESQRKTVTQRAIQHSKKAENLVEAAIRVITRDGAASMTHRAIAKEAGVSLSATTYYFASLDEIYVASYGKLVGNIIASNADLTSYAHAKQTRPPSLIASELARALRELSVSGIRNSANALAELELLAASKPELRSLSDMLLSRMGSMSTNMLQSVEGGSPNIDALDGVIWSRFSNGLIEYMGIVGSEEEELHRIIEGVLTVFISSNTLSKK